MLNKKTIAINPEQALELKDKLIDGASSYLTVLSALFSPRDQLLTGVEELKRTEKKQETCIDMASELHFKTRPLRLLQGGMTVEAGCIPAANPEPNIEDKLAALFDPVPVESLEKMFPASGKWKDWAERASRNGLKTARAQRKMFNPYRAALWFHKKGVQGWDLARCNRALANNLPARSRNEAHLFTGD